MDEGVSGVRDSSVGSGVADDGRCRVGDDGRGPVVDDGLGQDGVLGLGDVAVGRADAVDAVAAVGVAEAGRVGRVVLDGHAVFDGRGSDDFSLGELIKKKKREHRLREELIRVVKIEKRIMPI